MVEGLLPSVLFFQDCMLLVEECADGEGLRDEVGSFAEHVAVVLGIRDISREKGGLFSGQGLCRRAWSAVEARNMGRTDKLIRRMY